jgi:hypothetical protein
MSFINTAWAAPIVEGTESDVIEFYRSLQNERCDELRKHMQEAGNCIYYGAWLQTRPIGPWLIEYWTSDFNYQQLTQYLNQENSTFWSWYHEQKKAFCGDIFHEIKGLRKIVDRDLSDIIEPGDLYGNVIPIKSDLLGEAVAYIDAFDRAQPGERTKYFKNLGLAHWEAWLEEYDAQHYLVQMYNMQGNFEYLYKQFQQENTDFAKMVEDGGKHYFNMDPSDSKHWQKVNQILAVERNDRNKN